MPTQSRLISATSLAVWTLLGVVPAAWGNEAAVATAPAGTAPAAAMQVTVANDNLWNLAARVAHGPGVTRQQVMVALLRRNPDAFVQGNMHRLRRGVSLALPSTDEIAAEDVARSSLLVARHLSAIEQGESVPALRPLMPSGPAARLDSPPASVPAARPAAPAASSPRPTPASAAPVTPPGQLSGASAPALPPSASRPASLPLESLPPVSAASSVPETVPVAASAPSGSPPWVRLLPYAMAVLLVGAAAYLWRHRRARAKFEDSVVSSFFDENGVRRPSRPKVIDVSQAGVEMARTVETLQSAAEMVRGRAVISPQLPADGDPYREAAIKLEMARASLEVGRTEAARAMLLAVQREGNSDQQLAASDLLAGLAPV
jgi:FimV-like protein